MYPSGSWDGFWVQDYFGRQAMTEFQLRFDAGEIDGEGRDVIGPFTFEGVYDLQTGAVVMKKQYVGRHIVFYRGMPDGEGCIAGTWNIGDTWKGPFLIRPVVGRPRRDDPIHDA